jgi:hypothetical protein
MAASIRSGANDQAAPLTVMLGVLLGVLVPLTFVGGGTLGLPVLLLHYPPRRPDRPPGWR